MKTSICSYADDDNEKHVADDAEMVDVDEIVLGTVMVRMGLGLGLLLLELVRPVLVLLLMLLLLRWLLVAAVSGYDGEDDDN